MGFSKYLEDNREIWIENNRYKKDTSVIQKPESHQKESEFYENEEVRENVK